MEILMMSLKEIWRDLNDREKKIIREARDLCRRLEQSSKPVPAKKIVVNFDEPDIDAAFLFRLDPLWYEKAAEIRGIMRALLGQDGNKRLARDDGKSWVKHLMSNRGLTIQRSLAITEPGYYHCLDPSLRGAYLSDQEDRRQQWLDEATETRKVRRQLHWLAEMYNLLPQRHEIEDWGPNQIELQLRRIGTCIAFDRGTPDLFRWEKYRLVERQRRHGPGPNIRPEKWARRLTRDANSGTDDEGRGPQWIPVPDEGVRLSTRIRTWAIYYLTKRGGGYRTEQQAADIWNSFFADKLEAKRFREERDRMLDVTVTRRMRKKPEKGG